MQHHQQMEKDNGSPMKGGQYYQNENEQTYQGSPGSEQVQYNDGQRYQEDGQSSQKLVGSRVARKRAEEDMKLLSNRIALLKQEEKKAWRKIEETKKKAKDMMSVKQRNSEQQKLKEQKRKEKELEERLLYEKNANLRNQMKEGISLTKEQHVQKLREEAERLKLEKEEQKRLLSMQMEQEQLKNASVKQMIRNQEQEIQDRKRREMAEKKAKIRAELQQKILEENQKRLGIESEVSRLEQEELELIQKLQNTQILQKAAYDDLEGAVNNSLPSSAEKQGSSQSSLRKDYSPMQQMGSDQKGGNARR